MKMSSSTFVCVEKIYLLGYAYDLDALLACCMLNILLHQRGENCNIGLQYLYNFYLLLLIIILFFGYTYTIDSYKTFEKMLSKIISINIFAILINFSLLKNKTSALKVDFSYLRLIAIFAYYIDMQCLMIYQNQYGSNAILIKDIFHFSIY
jgi:hypothetical protein